MLKVQVELKESPGKGLGIFAKELIPKGKRIWKEDNVDMKFHEDALAELTPQEEKFLEKYAFLENGLWVLCADEGKYMNHSDTPNTYDNIAGTWALEDIQPGEEITCNYYEICEFVKEHGLGF